MADKSLRNWIVSVLAGTLFLVFSGMAGCPIYNVWQQGLAGKASLERAEQERQIQVMQAQAERDSASLRSEAIKIVGQAAKDFPEYRYQEFLGAFAEALQNGDIDKLIFVPTEANIPITEAGRSIGK
jgi:regulator of protease activity HflC (stomatin/prohibitin superfamily)